MVARATEFLDRNLQRANAIGTEEEVLLHVVTNVPDPNAALLLETGNTTSTTKKLTAAQKALRAEMHNHEMILLYLVTGYGDDVSVSQRLFEYRSSGNANSVDAELGSLLTDSAISDFLREVYRYRRLDEQEERALFQLLDDAVQLFERLGRPDLRNVRVTPEQEDFFVRAVAAHHILCLANIRLVVSTVKKYDLLSDLELIDLIQEGYIGLDVAVRRALPRLGYRLSTIAIPWIRQHAGRQMDNTGHIIRLPVKLRWRVNKLNTLIWQHQQDTGSFPTDAEIAVKMGLRLEQVAELQRWSECIAFSTDEPVDRFEPRKGERGDRVSGGQGAVVPEDRERLWRLLRDPAVTLTDQERVVIGLQCGFYDGINWQLEAIVGKLTKPGESPMTLDQLTRITARAVKKLAIAYKDSI